MTSVSKTTVDRERIINYVIYAVDHHLVPMADKVVGAVSPGKSPDSMTVTEFLADLARTLERKAAGGREADIGQFHRGERDH